MVQQGSNVQDSWGMSHPAQCSTSVEEAESRTGGEAACQPPAGLGSARGAAEARMVTRSDPGAQCRGNGIPRQ